MRDRVLVTRSSMPPLEEFINEIRPLWESRWLTNMGVKHREFEFALKERLETSNVALFTNGHNALECILEVMELPSAGEVITTPFTFASTTHAIVRKGLTPVFADISATNLTLDPRKVEEMISPRTCAILPVHVYGNPCEVDAIQQVADRHGLKVIYDAAHAFGVKLGGASIADFGDASMFSFHATKVFNTIEGGAVCFKDKSLYKKLNDWKNFGITSSETVEYVGGNAKMNEFCAAMGLCNLRHFDSEVAKRKVVADRYRENLRDVSGLRFIQPAPEVEYNYAYMPVLVSPDEFGHTRDDVLKLLANEGIVARKYFYPLVSDFACYRTVYSSDRTPIAVETAASVLTLPLYADLTVSEVDVICDVVKS